MRERHAHTNKHKPQIKMTSKKTNVYTNIARTHTPTRMHIARRAMMMMIVVDIRREA